MRKHEAVLTSTLAQSMFLCKHKKNRYTPAYPSLLYIKLEFKGVDMSFMYS